MRPSRKSLSSELSANILGYVLGTGNLYRMYSNDIITQVHYPKETRSPHAYTRVKISVGNALLELS